MSEIPHQFQVEAFMDRLKHREIWAMPIRAEYLQVGDEIYLQCRTEDKAAGQADFLGHGFPVKAKRIREIRWNPRFQTLSLRLGWKWWLVVLSEQNVYISDKTAPRGVVIRTRNEVVPSDNNT